MNKRSGDVINDFTENKINGNLTSGVTWVQRDSNWTLLFSGNSHNVDIPRDPSIGSYMSIVVKICYRNSTPNWQRCVGRWDFGSANLAWAFFWPASTTGNAVKDKWNFLWSTTGAWNNNDAVSSINNIVLNRWYQLVATHDGANVRLYVDSILEDTQAEGGTIHNAVDDGITLGYYGDGIADHRPFYGEIEYIYLYDRPLTQSEINYVYVRPFYMFDRPAKPLFHVAGGAPPTITPLFMDLGTFYWTIKKANGLYSRL